MSASIRASWQVSIAVLTCVAPSVVATARQSAPFASRMYDTTGTVRRVIAADLDVDGDLDLVNTLGNKFQVRWNQGDGVLAAPSNFTVGTTCEDVVAIDWDGDNDLDLFAVNFGSDNVFARRKGVGTNYSAAGTFAAGSQPHAISAADLDANGFVDLVVANYAPSTVSVLLGTSATSFAAPVAYPIAGYGYELELADFDGDALLDIATANLTGDGLSVLRGLGNGTFAAQAAYNTGVPARDVLPVDLDQDGDLDLALATTQARGTGYVVAVHWNQGGLFPTSSQIVVGSIPHALAAGDFDGDLDPDLAVACYGSNRVYVLASNGGSLSVSAFVESGSAPSDAISADLDGDGWLDLITTSSQLQTVGVFEGRGDGTFADTRVLFAGQDPQTLLPADFTGDGVLDFVAHGFGELKLVPGLGGGAFGAAVDLPVPGTLLAAAAGDVDGDSDVDVVVARQSPHGYTVLFNNGAGSFTAGSAPAGSSLDSCIALADVDGDLDLDLLLGDNFAATIAVHANLGTGVFASPVAYALQGRPRAMVLGNMNADAFVDLAVVVDGGTCVLLGAGSGNFGPSTVYSGGSDDITAGDFDNDGDLDLAMPSISSGTLVRLAGVGDGTFLPLAPEIQFHQPWRITSGDVDADGDIDIVTGDYDGTLSLRVNDGAGNLAAPVLLPLRISANDVVLVDVDGDLDVDAVAATSAITPGGDSLTIHANTRVEEPWVYCVPKTTSTGCVPSLSFAGAPSVSSSSPFSIQASSLRNQKTGLLFYGYRAKAAAFQGGTLCVANPTRRTPVQSSGGSALPIDDCSGVFTLDFNAWIQSGVDPLLVAGADAYAQHWSRDPGSPSTTGLSDALHLRVRP